MSTMQLVTLSMVTITVGYLAVFFYRNIFGSED